MSRSVRSLVGSDSIYKANLAAHQNKIQISLVTTEPLSAALLRATPVGPISLKPQYWHNKLSCST
ncbi:hypothetical protein J6590_091791 [Homalodisca vitripennis]|nr:hypothetical protein J6590_091791 [Homalodisca vitripennis]